MIDDRKLLEQVAKMTQENNDILRGMRRAQRWGRFVRLLWWVFILITSGAAYYYLRPILLGFLETYEQILSGTAGPSSPSIVLDRGLMEQLRSFITALR